MRQAGCPTTEAWGSKKLNTLLILSLTRKIPYKVSSRALKFTELMQEWDSESEDEDDSHHGITPRSMGGLHKRGMMHPTKSIQEDIQE